MLTAKEARDMVELSHSPAGHEQFLGALLGYVKSYAEKGKCELVWRQVSKITGFDVIILHNLRDLGYQAFYDGARDTLKVSW